MGKISIEVRIRKDRKSRKTVKLGFLLDSGMSFTLAPGPALRRLGVEPDRKKSFLLRNGEIVTREVGEAYFEFQGQGGTSKVIFGEKGDCNIVGTMTLAAVELILDPLKREFKPLPMLLMRAGVRNSGEN